MNELIQKVEQWAIDRNLHTASPQGQALKVVEEFTETLMAHDREDSEEVIDGIGDTYVTLIIICQQLDIDFPELANEPPNYFRYLGIAPEAINRIVSGVAKSDKYSVEEGASMTLGALECLIEQYGTTPIECLSIAYDEIKDRKGRMIDGVFVKESDLMSSSFSEIEELARQYALTLSENGEGDDESFGRLKKYADEVGVNVTIYNLSLTTADDSIDDSETLLESVRLTGKWGCAISVKGESK